MKSTPKGFVAVGVVVALTLLGACGGDDSSGSSPSQRCQADACSDGSSGPDADAGCHADGCADVRPSPEQDDSCEFSEDGICDEPANCPLGTDETDCTAACESGDEIYLFGAACNYRNPAAGQHPNDGQPPAGADPRTGFIDRTTTIASGVDGRDEFERKYRIEVPRAYDPSHAYPLVINMAGHRVDHRVMPPHTDLPRSADLNNFIVVYAGQEFRQGRWAWWTDWDWKNKTDQNPDFEFIRTIIDQVGDDYHLDDRRIYLSGHSRGAAMAFIGAIELDDIIAGAVVESGFTEFGYLDDRLQQWDGRNVPLVFIHGVLDDDVCIDCRPGASCSAAPARSCPRGFHAADAIVERLESLGWKRGKNLKYYRLENVAHRWQSQLNQQWWDFLSVRPMPASDP